MWGYDVIQGRKERFRLHADKNKNVSTSRMNQIGSSHLKGTN
jgi:hypothetical protein